MSRRGPSRASAFVRAWTDAAPGDDAAGLLAAATRQLARARGLDPAAVGQAGPEPAAGLPVPDSVEDLAALHEALRSPGPSRKAEGAFYTPPSLASALVDATLAPLLAQPGRPATSLRIADPACGAGAFLVPTLRRLRAAAPQAGAAELLRCLAGVDRDPTAVALCRDLLWLELRDPDLPPERVAERIRCGDALLGVPARLLGPSAGADREARDRWLADALGPGSTPPDAWRPLHWELEFAEAAPGFDAVLGNPPWDVDKPDARAFFARFDPGHRGRRKQDALRAQRTLLAGDPGVAAAWRAELERAEVLRRFCRARFRLQPPRGDANAYQRFVELGLELLAEGGRLGMLVPAGLYADLGSRRLREVLLSGHRVEKLVGFENRARLFPGVDSRFKLAALVVQSGGRTEELDVSFMQRDADALRRRGTTLPAAAVARLSPRSRALVEVDEPRALALLERLGATGATFGGGAWQIEFRREFDLTLDSRCFLPPDADGMPLWEGRMIGGYDFAQKGWVAGHGRAAVWRELRWPDKAIEPQYRVSPAEFAARDRSPDRPKVGFMAVGSATNARTMVATVLWRAPCGNSVPTLRCRPAPSGAPGELGLCAALNSFVYDWALRARLAGNNLNRFVLDETPLPDPDLLLGIEGLAAAVASLCWAQPWFDPAWALLPAAERARAAPLRDPADRSRLRAVLDAVVAAAYGLGSEDLAFVLRDTDLPIAELEARARTLDPKGLWRVDRGEPPQRRATVGALAEFRALEARLDRGANLAEAAAAALAAAVGRKAGPRPPSRGARPRR